MSPIKKAKSDAARKYFDFSFQTEKTHVCAVCFSPEKWKRLETYKSEGKNCVINNVFRTKQLEFTLTNSSTVKEKILMFEKSEKQNYSSTEIVIDEYELISMVSVIVKIVQTGKLQFTNHGLSLKEYKVIK